MPNDDKNKQLPPGLTPLDSPGTASAGAAPAPSGMPAGLTPIAATPVGPDFSQRPSWWDTVKNLGSEAWKLTPPGQAQEGFQKVSEGLAPIVEKRRQENLVAAAKGQPTPHSETGDPYSGDIGTAALGMGESAARFGAGATSPTGVAVGAATLALPEVMGPALVAHGGYNLAESLPEALQGNPEAAEKALSSGAEMAGGAAAFGGPSGPVRNFIRERAMENPDTAALKAVGVDPNSPKAAKALADIQKARPYAGAPKTQAELQTNLGGGSPARNEIWDNYNRALQQVGNRVVNGPDGPATVNALEAERLELSARNRLAKSGNPSALQELAQKGLSVADSLARERAIQGAIDPELATTGLDPKLTRATMGGVKGVSRRIEGREGRLESAPSGIGRLVDKGRINVGSSGPSIYMPENIRTAIAGGAKDIAAGRGWFRQVPADTAAREGFRNPGARPTLTGPPPPTPTPFRAPPALPQSPPNAAGTIEGTGTVQAPNLATQGRNVTGQQINELPQNLEDYQNEFGVKGLLPGPPAPFVPPTPGPDLPQTGAPPAASARFPEESPMWSPSVGRGDPVNWNAPRPEFPESLTPPPPRPPMTYPSSPTLPDPTWTRSAGPLTTEWGLPELPGKPPVASPPTDLTTAPEQQPSATVLPESVRPDFTDQSVHPWESEARVDKKAQDLAQGGDATIVARPNPDGTVSPVKGHNTPVAAARTGQPVNVVDSGPITDGEKAAMTAESHFFPADDRAVPASLAKDAASERASLPDEIKDAPALPAKEGPEAQTLQSGTGSGRREGELPEQLGLKGGIKAQGVESTLKPRDPALELQNHSSEISRLQEIIRNPAATAEEKAIASSQLLANQRLRAGLQKRVVK